MKLSTTTQVSVDGVVQGCGGPGTTLQVYRPAGRLQCATATAD